MSWVQETLKSLIDMAIGPEFIRGAYEENLLALEEFLDEQLEAQSSKIISLKGSLYIHVNEVQKALLEIVAPKYLAQGWTAVTCIGSSPIAYFRYDVPNVSSQNTEVTTIEENPTSRNIKT